MTCNSKRDLCIEKFENSHVVLKIIFENSYASQRLKRGPDELDI